MSGSHWQPKEPRWAIGTAVFALVSVLLYVASILVRPLDPARGTGLWFGVAATLLFVVEALYPLRRGALSKPLGNARRWIQLHIWGGLLAALFVLVHAGFRKPGGTMGWLLLLLTLWVTFTGLFGVFLQKYYPVALSRNLSVEVLFDRIPEVAQKLADEAEKLVQNTSDVLQGFYQTEVKPALAGAAPSWNYLVDVRGGREKRLQPFLRIMQFLPEEERPRLEDLKTIYVEKLELDAHVAVQRVLRSWTILHVPPAAVLLALMTLHVAAFFLY